MSVQSGKSPETHSDGRRTTASLVDCLIGDMQVVLGEMDKEKLRAIENRFHVTLRMDRRLRERFSKKRRRNTPKTK